MVSFTPISRAIQCFGCLATLFVLTTSISAADIAAARTKYYEGKYDECIELCQAEVASGIWNDYWSRQLIQALLATGRYQEARDVYVQVETKFASSVPLRMLAAEAYRYCGQADKGDKLLDDIPALIQAAPWRFSDRENLLAIGKFFLAEGEDPRAVLDAFYDKAIKSDPRFVDAYLGIAELAIGKADYQEALKSLTKAVELRPEDPYIHFLLAKAWAPSDAEKATEYLQAALSRNPHHPESLLMQAENLIDSENYEEASRLLDALAEINPHHAEVWALRAAMSHLMGKYKDEGEQRGRALQHWNLNPQVDYLIGKKLSQHYRFAEGVVYQRRALRMNPKYLPSKFQLAQDLLRVGQDDEGWSIVDEVSATDKYNVVAYNLKTLQSRLAKFVTIESPGFMLRMDAREAKIYGDRALKLLQEAKQVLSEKYGIELTEPVTVEIFPQQSDFAIRTFGLPGGAGFLGVCFGKLITANSPASQGDSPSNWESVLWHEFCHVITLQKTKNRMPRWLSEGISVYEELQRDSAWGQRMNPRYKEMLLGDDFVPLSKLSGAFLHAESPLHLQFAYFESSLAVKYLIEKHGLDLLRKLLDDLGAGVPIHDAFARRYGDVELLDQDFAEYVKSAANAFVKDTSFERKGLPQRATLAEWTTFLEQNPNNYFAQRSMVLELIKEEKWSEANKAAQRLVDLYPDDSDPDGSLELQARVARQLNDLPAEKASLEKMVSLTGDSVPSLLRLIQIYRQEKAWEQMRQAADKLVAVQPLIATGHEATVEAAEQLRQPEKALQSLTALQELQPLDPAKLHYQLANALLAAGEIAAARIEVLQALEETPRYRDAQQLLLKIVAEKEKREQKENE